MAEMIMDVSPKGDLSIEVKGVKGKRCLDLTKDIEDALGTVEKRVETGEMKQSEQHEQLRLRQ